MSKCICRSGAAYNLKNYATWLHLIKTEIQKYLMAEFKKFSKTNIFADEIEQIKLIELSSGRRVLIDVAKKKKKKKKIKCI